MEMINIAEILKNVKIGTKLYSPFLGEATLNSICFDASFPIGVLDSDDDPWNLDKFGRISEKGECMLFPSKEMRDWCKFSWKKEKECGFQPFDKVLARDYNDSKWVIDIFSHTYQTRTGQTLYACISSSYYQCIPYNEETKHLLGTTENWEE